VPEMCKDFMHEAIACDHRHVFGLGDGWWRHDANPERIALVCARLLQAPTASPAEPVGSLIPQKRFSPT